ncbi:MAG: tRNA threonylcarbamoyladenosine biosynthesis protein RimN [Gammaproteobacteria bacterium]|nr:tRNA threonylcarbamoyladenosine biosynthesis protein RimN [Gammaproteobacteria bacterium]MBT3488098.1 tRNA threonylcarbamoyladenosine biosynthesis protein RimN [Gammaproteobacteria bacterium]MBT3719554.1 tRNA threonylcarbamoyladenosine biosynthesis protein RimN [Gammaproteobacteria bacterium]MBT3844902.1 tRNA threonylcarbamoyladenosine biosynthesis protein RimN [Gammaproteobacteria bacterium]MBT3893889.1 tRNA threonylcarbamoyladenosine biosynthesis protein RimN [Gammaproteobacteria bacterium
MHSGPYTPWKMRQFTSLFRAGAVFAYPTESIFGLGCDPWNLAAVERVWSIKQRAPEKGLILVASNPQQLRPWIALRHAADWQRLSASSRRPTTWLVPAAAGAPWWIKGAHPKIAVRLTTFSPMVQLCETVSSAIVSTSANFAGFSPLRNTVSVYKVMSNQLDMIISGETGSETIPSEIRDFYSGEVLRSN